MRTPLSKPRGRSHAEEFPEVWDGLQALSGSPMLRDARRFAAGRRTLRQKRLWLAGGAASLVVASAAALLVLGAEKPLEISTRVNQVKTVRLTDGSEITLDAESAVEVRYGLLDRRVRLSSGRAWFDVAKNKVRPFKVEAGQTVVTAVGTAFDVATGATGVDVTLARGAVLVSASRSDGRQVLRLTPGEQAHVEGQGEMRRRRIELARAGAWRQGVIDLDRVSLAAALEEINRHLAHKIEVEDPAASNKLVSGVFRAGDEKAVTAAITGLFGEACSAPGRQAVITCRPGASGSN
ncbi:MAG: FecR domain-containing protein [Caulobacteraceae bacterium]|nr:FecR domain-containing protein [Caulobacteraceae bacterium]